MSHRLGIDIGGTFTDFVLLSDNGDLQVAKVSSNPEDLDSVIDEGLGHGRFTRATDGGEGKE